ncbi:MAG: 2OG-Fe(II) oxygenase [Dokdonella sp.]
MHQADFIEVYDDIVDTATCRALIARFDASGKAVRGATGSGVDTRLKDSWDICINDHAEWKDAENRLNTALMQAMLLYIRKYPYTALAPLSLRMPHPETGEPFLITPDDLRNVPDATLQTMLVRVFRPGSINIQRYLADQGGYPYWHCELYPKDATCETLHRTLLWTLYLNDGFAEGETEFAHQQRKIVPRTGSMLIAPAAFTHTHRGNRPIGGDKYIATSWLLFQRADVLFKNPPVAPEQS